MDTEKTKNIAIIIAHGMGQQVKFETLSSIADMIQSCCKVPPENIKAIIHNNEETNKIDIPLIEMRYISGNNSGKNVDIYEVYWAPFTEGMIKAYEITLFLLEHGIRFSVSTLLKSIFERFIFNKWQEFKIAHFGAFFLLTGFTSVLCGIILIYFTTGYIFIFKLIKFFLDPVLSHDALNSSLLADVKSFYLPVLMIAFLLFIFALIKKVFIRLTGISEKRNIISSSFISLSIVLFLLFIIFTDLKIITDLLNIHFESLDSIRSFINYFPNLIISKLPWLTSNLLFSFKAIFFASVIGILFYLRSKYIQYLGDVVIYVSSHTLNRFDEVRSKIKDAGKNVFNYVYSKEKDPQQKNEPKENKPAAVENLEKFYDKIIVIGHSLGSVIAYDCLNGVIKSDEGVNEENIKRTQALITFGSPLNKTAFLFRKQVKGSAIFREMLALEKQPLVKNYDDRPSKWINIYSRRDLVSGKLRFYDPAKENECDPLKKVQNIPDPEANTLLLAHTEYWNNKLLPEILVREIKEAF